MFLLLTLSDNKWWWWWHANKVSACWSGK